VPDSHEDDRMHQISHSGRFGGFFPFIILSFLPSFFHLLSLSFALTSSLSLLHSHTIQMPRLCALLFFCLFVYSSCLFSVSDAQYCGLFTNLCSCSNSPVCLNFFDQNRCDSCNTCWSDCCNVNTADTAAYTATANGQRRKKKKNKPFINEILQTSRIHSCS